MKKMLSFIFAFVVIISLFFVCEFAVIDNNIAMPTMMKYIFSASFMILSLSTITYLIYSKFSKHPTPDFIADNIIEIIALSIAVLMMSIILLFKK